MFNFFTVWLHLTHYVLIMSRVNNEGSFWVPSQWQRNYANSNLSEAFSISAHIKLSFLSEQADLKNGTIEALI